MTTPDDAGRDQPATLTVGRVHLEPEETAEPDPMVEVEHAEADNRWTPERIGMGIVALIMMIGALVFILQGVFQSAPK